MRPKTLASVCITIIFPFMKRKFILKVQYRFKQFKVENYSLHKFFNKNRTKH